MQRALHSRARLPAALRGEGAPAVGAVEARLLELLLAAVLLGLALLDLRLRLPRLALLVVSLHALAPVDLAPLLLLLLLRALQVHLLLLLQPLGLDERRVALLVLPVVRALPLVLEQQLRVRAHRVRRARRLPSVGPPQPELARAEHRRRHQVQVEVRLALDQVRRRAVGRAGVRLTPGSLALVELPARRRAGAAQPQQPPPAVGALDGRALDEAREALELRRGGLAAHEQQLADPPAILVEHLHHDARAERAQEGGRRGGRQRPQPAHRDGVDELDVGVLALVEGVVAHLRLLVVHPPYGQQVGDEGRAVVAVAFLQHLHHLLLLWREAAVGARLVGVGVLVERAPRVARVRDEAAALIETHRREGREPGGIRVVLLRRAVGERPLAAP